MTDWDTLIKMAWIAVGTMIAIGLGVGVAIGWFLRGRKK